MVHVIADFLIQNADNYVDKLLLSLVNFNDMQIKRKKTQRTVYCQHAIPCKFTTTPLHCGRAYGYAEELS